MARFLYERIVLWTVPFKGLAFSRDELPPAIGLGHLALFATPHLSSNDEAAGNTLPAAIDSLAPHYAYSRLRLRLIGCIGMAVAAVVVGDFLILRVAVLTGVVAAVDRVVGIPIA